MAKKQISSFFPTRKLDQMRMGGIQNNSVGKNTLTETLFNRQCSVVSTNSILAIFIIIIKIPSNPENEMKPKRRRKACYILSYLLYKCLEYSISHIIPKFPSMYKILLANIEGLKNLAIFNTDR